jgi:hypothetical protein
MMSLDLISWGWDVQDDIDLAIINERNHEIKKIEQDVTTISEISTDIAMMVHAQAEDIDTANKNIETTAESTQTGVVALELAQSHKSHSFLLQGTIGCLALSAVGGGVCLVSLPAGLALIGVGLLSELGVVCVHKIVQP